MFDGNIGLDTDFEGHPILGWKIGVWENGDFSNQFGHAHFDVEFDNVGERVKLHVSDYCVSCESAR